jgi:hypothetical protein
LRPNFQLVDLFYLNTKELIPYFFFYIFISYFTFTFFFFFRTEWMYRRCMESMREDAGQTGLFPTTEPQKMLKLLVLSHRSEKSTYVYNTSSIRNIHHHMHACPWKSSVFCFWLWSRTLVNLFLGFGFKNIAIGDHFAEYFRFPYWKTNSSILPYYNFIYFLSASPVFRSPTSDLDLLC